MTKEQILKALIERKKQAVKGVIFLVLFTCTASFMSNNKKTPKTGLKLVWHDEFNYEGLPNADKWNYDVGGTGWGNNELQYYTSKRQNNVTVTDGKLYIKALKENYQNKEYTSARLVTKGKRDFRYGKIEIKAKIPKGRGVWPAIWMLSSKTKRVWPDDGEIDILENVGYAKDEITGAAHVKKNSTGNDILSLVNETIIPGASEDFHVYSLTWTPDRLEWFVDGKSFHSYDKTDKPAWQWPFDGRFYLIMNVAVGGSWGGRKGIDTAIFPQALVVDYVRVYGK